MSLTSCLKKAGDAIAAEDSAAILERARVLRGKGMTATLAGRQAVEDQIVVIRELLSGQVSKQADEDKERAEEATRGTSPEETEEIGEAFDEAAEAGQSGEEGPIHHLFEEPTKSEVVRLQDKVRVYNAKHGWMTVAEATKVIAGWQEHAVGQGKDETARNANGQRVVLSFFDLTGAWSMPWEQAGYDVWRFDIQNDAADAPQDERMGDVNNFSTDFFGDWFGDFEGKDIYAILAACPCTDFASSGARHFAAKDADGRTVASVKLVHQSLAAIEYFKPAVWAIENPVGRIESLTGLPPWRLSFDPNHLGDPYTKKTLLWGRFNADLPIAPVEPTEGSKMHQKYGGKSQKTKNARSVTPEGFSYGFFMANNAIDNPAMAIANKFDRLDRGLIEKAVAVGVTEEQITQAVEDFYYMDLDDAAANKAIRDLTSEAVKEKKAAEAPPAPKEPPAGTAAERLAWRIENDLEAVRREYAAMPESSGGKIISADLAKMLSPEYRADKPLSDSLQKLASQFADAEFRRKLAEAPGPGEDPLVIFTAGGTGAGKSTGLQKNLADTAKAHIIFDGNMSNLVAAKARIGAALGAGHNVDVRYVYREPGEAFKHGVIPRAKSKKDGRPVTAANHAKTHANSNEVVRGLADYYAKNDRVAVLVFDNSHGKGNAVEISIEELPVVDYDTAHAASAKELDYAFRKGRVDAKLYRNLGGTLPDSEFGVSPRSSEAPRPSVPAKPEQAGRKERVAPASRSKGGESTGDAGEELRYNRRNLGMDGLSWDQLKGLNTALRVKETTKAKVWPKPDYAALIESGMPPIVARMVKHFYDALPAKPGERATSDESLEAYVDGLARIKDAVFGWATDKAEVAAFLAIVEKEQAPRGERFDYTERAEMHAALKKSTDLIDRAFAAGFRGNEPAQMRNNAVASAIGGNKTLRKLRVDSGDIKTSLAEVARGWPESQESWERKGITVQRTADMGLRVESGESTRINRTTMEREPYTWFAVRGRTSKGSFHRAADSKEEAESYIAMLKPFTVMDKYGRIQGGAETEEAAKELIRAFEAKQRKRSQSDTPAGVDASSAGRVGPERREAGKSISTEELMSAFGFRGINFGNWMKGASNSAERQMHLNKAYDSFMDLAELLGVPPKAMSLNGLLGIAFGAQGRAGAAAHFVPGVNEINLTRVNGAGALAHEWGHAVDHYFATQAGEKYVRTQHPFLTALNVGSDSGLRPEIVAAFKNIVKTMESRDATPEEEAKRSSGMEEQNLKSLNGAIDHLRSGLGRDMVKPENRERALELFDKLANRLRAGDLGQGVIKYGPGKMQAYREVVGRMRNLIKDYTGRVPGKDWMDLLDSRASSRAYYVQKINETAQHVPQKVDTNYKAIARQLDVKKKDPYWSSKWEMFARAFESFAMDRLADKERLNDYLVRSNKGPEAEAMWKDGFPYPKDAERDAINAAFDTLVGELKTDENNRLYSKRRKADPSQYEIDLFGNPLSGASGGPAMAAPERSEAPGDVSTAPGLQDTDRPEGAYHVRTLLGEEGRRQLGASRILTAADAAKATAYLYRSATERFDGIVTDKDGVPLAVVGGFKGTIDGASVYPSVVIAEIMRVKGAAKVWFSHNHPSGIATLSQADEMIMRRLSDNLDGSGVESMGILAIGEGKYDHMDPRGNPRSGEVPAPDARLMVPVVSREQVGTVKGQPVLDSPRTSSDFAKKILAAENSPGLILMNNRHIAIGWVPIPAEARGALKNTGGLNAIYRALAHSNAAAAIIVDNGELSGKVSGSKRTTVAQNIATALAGAEIRVLDILTDGGKPADKGSGGLVSAANTGEISTTERLFVKRATPTQLSAKQAGVRAWLKLAGDTLNGLATVHVLDNVQQLRDALGDQEVEVGVEGVHTTNDGAVYFVVDQIEDLARARKVFLHEVFGHFAMERSPDMQAALNMVLAMRDIKHRGVTALWNEVAHNQPGLSRRDHAKEVIALMAERGVKNSALDRMIAAFKSLLRKMGFRTEFSEAEIRAIIARAARNLNKDVAAMGASDRNAAAKAGREVKWVEAAEAEMEGGAVALASYRAGEALEDVLPDGDALDGRLYSKRAPMPKEAKDTLDRVMVGGTSEGHSFRDHARNAMRKVRDMDGLGMQQSIFDFAASIASYEKALNGGELMDAANSPYKQVLSTQNLASVMSSVMEHGIPVWKNGVYKIEQGRKGLSKIFQPLTENESGNLIPHFELYAAARRASRLITEQNEDGTSREKLFTPAEIAAGLALADQYPVLEQVFNDWQEFNKQSLDMMQDAGLIDADSRAIWERNDYVPFYRAIEDMAGIQGPMNRSGVAGQRSGVKTLTGRDAQLGNILENMLMNIAHSVDASFKNRAAQAVADSLDGVAMTKMPLQWQPVDISNDQMAKALKLAGVAVDKMTKDQREQWGKVFRRVAPAGKNIVTVMRGGKPEYYEVLDPMLLRSITAMGMNPIIRQLDVMGMLSGSKRLLTQMVTAHPHFIIANFIRDTLATWVQSPLKLGVLSGAFKGFRDVMRNDKDFVAIMTAGGGGGTIYDTQPAHVRKLLLRKMPASQVDGFLKTIVSPKKLWDFYRRMQVAAENANRLRVYRAAKKAGASDAEAAYQARDVLNFAMRGDHVAVQALTMSVPFLNARLQGLYRLYRGYQQNKAAFLIRGAIITAATLALMAVNDDDERYQELQEWDRDAYWHFWIGEAHFRIPRPFEVGAAFATMPERAIRAMKGDDSTRVVAQSMTHMVVDTFAFNPLPQLFKPVYEQYMNKLFFTGNPIVGMAEQGLKPEAQYNERTSPILIEIANAMPDIAPAHLRSPMRLEALVRGYLGSMGIASLAMADGLTRGGMGYPDAPSREWHEIAFERFVKHGEPQSTKYTAELYRMADEANQAARTISTYARGGEAEKAREAGIKYADQLARRKQLNKMVAQMRKLNQSVGAVMSSQTLTADQKRERIEALKARRNELARRVMKFEESFQ